MHLLNNDPQSVRQAAVPAQRPLASTVGAYLLITVFSIMILAGCIVQTPGNTTAPGTKNSAAPGTPAPTLPDNFNGAVEDLSGYVLPTPASASTSKLSVVVSADGSRANIRSGPGTSFPIISKANPGAAFTVVSKSSDATWWRVRTRCLG